MCGAKGAVSIEWTSKAWCCRRAQQPMIFLSHFTPKCYPHAAGRKVHLRIMKSMKKVSPIVLAYAALLLTATAVSAQQTDAPTKVSNVAIQIKNFGQMDERFFRGGQPRKNDYKDLAALGIKTVIDLRDDPESYERPLVESLGMKYVNIP